MAARVRRVLVVGATVAACGRVGFEARHTDGGAVDTASIDTPGAAPRLVGMTSSNGTSGGSQLAIAAITPGDVLVVAVTTWDGTPVTSITAGMPLTSAGARAVMGATSSELWYAAPAVAASTVTVTMASSTTSFDVWAAEFEHIAPAPLATGSGCLQYPPDVVTAPVTATAPGQLVFGATMLAAPVYVNAVAAPFTAFPIEDGNGAAYTITTAAGSYGPSWSVGAGSGMTAMTCASTVLFAPQ